MYLHLIEQLIKRAEKPIILHQTLSESGAAKLLLSKELSHGQVIL